MMNEKWFLIKVCIYSFIVCFLITSFNYYVDPLHHRSYKPFLMNNFLRFTHSGLARTYPYDAVIIGTSTSQNLPVDLLNSVFEAAFLKLTLDGGTAYEEKTVVELALRQKEVKNVVWSLDLFAFRGAPARVRPDTEMPFYLYDTHPLNDLRYYLSWNTFVWSTKLFYGLVFNRRLPEFSKDPEENQQWFKKDEHLFTLENVKEHRATMRRSFKKEEAPLFTFEYLSKSFESNCVSVIQKNPNTKFILYFPPYSVFFFKEIRELSPETYQDILKFKAYAYERLIAMPNVALYDFQVDFETINSIENYKDLTHFHLRVDEKVVGNFASDNFRVKKESQTLFLKAFDENIQKVSFPLL